MPCSRRCCAWLASTRCAAWSDLQRRKVGISLPCRRCAAARCEAHIQTLSLCVVTPNIVDKPSNELEIARVQVAINSSYAALVLGVCVVVGFATGLDPQVRCVGGENTPAARR